MDHTDTHTAKLIRGLRASERLKLADVADVAGCTYQWLGKIEGGATLPQRPKGLATLGLFARAVGAPWPAVERALKADGLDAGRISKVEEAYQQGTKL